MFDEEIGAVILHYHYGDFPMNNKSRVFANVEQTVLTVQKNEQDVPYRFGWNKLDFKWVASSCWGGVRISWL